MNIIGNQGVNLDIIEELSKKPEIFTRSEELFWDDPHISKQMLKAHLDPERDAASRNHKTIRKSVNWIISTLNLPEGSHILDLGCGPGLYSSLLCERGYRVTGIDYSKRSIKYAEQFGLDHNLSIEYIYQDYRTMNYDEEFDAVLLIYCDFGALTNDERDMLLGKIKRALKPDGYFVFDVLTTNFRKKSSLEKSWNICKSGFWKPNPYLELSQTFYYPEEETYLDQIIILEESGKLSVYRIWDHCYNVETITNLLNRYQFTIHNITSDLTGVPYSDESESLGIIAKKCL